MSNFNPKNYNSMNNVMSNHPLIENANQYFSTKKYVSINSEDRDIIKYPISTEFEIELPQDYLNVVSVKLHSWSFPANYDVFSLLNSNITVVFKFIQVYEPFNHDNFDIVAQAIFAALETQIETDYIITIEEGFYNPEQMATELTNKLNESTTHIINNFLNDPVNVQYAEAKRLFKTYDRFKIVYNSVSQKLWFGNTADQFMFANHSTLLLAKSTSNLCIRKNNLPSEVNWGLPPFLGLSKINVTSRSEDNQFRFYYGDVTELGDNGFWLLPSEPGATVYFIEPVYKINFMGPAYMYMDIDGLNCIDETSPYNTSKFTLTTNETNGIVNSSFAKIAIPTTPISQWFDADNSAPYKFFNPPCERIRKLKIKLRYHNRQLVDFGTFDYSFMMEFTLLNPQQERQYNIRAATDLTQMQGK
jgi:hypothetical protein